MRVWVGDETGLLKGVHVEGKRQLCKFQEQDRSKEILRMCWGPGDESQKESLIFLGLKNKSVRAVDSINGAVVHEHSGFDSEFVGLDVIGESLATGTAGGVVQYRQWDKPDAEATYQKVHAADMYRMRTCAEASSLYAIGGKGHGNDLKIFDVNKDDPIFKAKNVSNDNVDLEVPIWIHDLAFIPASFGSKVVTVTAHRHIRLYDSKVKKKPIFSLEFGERPIMSVVVTNDGNSIIFGNAIGEMRKVDLRTAKISGSYKGPAGSVRSITCHPTMPLVASCGLDRHAYVHNLNGAAETKVYLKQRLNAILFSGEGRTAAEPDGETAAEHGGTAAQANEDQEAEGSTDEEIWDAMEVVEDKGTKRPKADKPGEKPKKKAKKP